MKKRLSASQSSLGTAGYRKTSRDPLPRSSTTRAIPSTRKGGSSDMSFGREGGQLIRC